MLEKRNYGVDIAKIISMLMVVVLHVLYHGKVLEAASYGSIEYYVFWFLYVLALCAVNCFAISTGYIMIKKEFHYRQLISLWLQVSFYSIFITVLVLIFNTNEITISNITRALFPVIREQYWYVSCYFGMGIFIPFLNALINSLNKRNLTRLVILSILMFSIITTISRIDVFKLNNGFSPLWIIVLYIIGAWIRLINIDKKLSIKESLISYVVCVFVTWLSKIILEMISYKLFGKAAGGQILFNYTSPTILFAAIFLFIACAQIKITNDMCIFIIKKLIISNFAVYLIHDHLLTRRYFISNLSLLDFKNNVLISILLIIVIAIFIYGFCICVDKLRIIIFNKLKINNICNFIEEITVITINRVSNKNSENNGEVEDVY